MKQTSKRLISIIGSLVLVIVALIAFFQIIQPEYSSVAQLKGKVAAENDMLQTETQLVASVQTIINQYQQQAGSAQTVVMALPNGEDISGALAQVYGLAQNNGIALQNLQISPPSLQLSATASGGDTTTGLATEPLGTFSLQAGGTGSYQNFVNFLMGLETNVRIFDVTAVSIAPASTAGLLNFSLTISTYYQSNQSVSSNQNN